MNNYNCIGQQMLTANLDQAAETGGRLRNYKKRGKAMTKIYVSPSCLTYRQYDIIIKAAYSYGWQPTWLWSRQIFHADAYINEEKALKAMASIVHADIFATYLPGTTTTSMEIGAAYFLAQSVFLAAKDPIHFTQTGPCDAYLAVLPDIKRICCEAEDIPEKLKQEYYPLITGS